MDSKKDEPTKTTFRALLSKSATPHCAILRMPEVLEINT